MLRLQTRASGSGTGGKIENAIAAVLSARSLFLRSVAASGGSGSLAVSLPGLPKRRDAGSRKRLTQGGVPASAH
jgi:hypothetical protein